MEEFAHYVRAYSYEEYQRRCHTKPMIKTPSRREVEVYNEARRIVAMYDVFDDFARSRLWDYVRQALRLGGGRAAAEAAAYLYLYNERGVRIRVSPSAARLVRGKGLADRARFAALALSRMCQGEMYYVCCTAYRFLKSCLGNTVKESTIVEAAARIASVLLDIPFSSIPRAIRGARPPYSATLRVLRTCGITLVSNSNGVPIYLALPSGLCNMLKRYVEEWKNRMDGRGYKCEGEGQENPKPALAGDDGGGGRREDR